MFICDILHIPNTFKTLQGDIHSTIFPTLVDQEKHPINSIDDLFEQH